MKKLWKILLLATALLLIACVNAKTEEQHDRAEEPIAEEMNVESGESVFGTFTTKQLDGTNADQTIFAANKLTMVNIWGTYCGPCLYEMPYLGELAAEYADKGFGIVGIPVNIAAFDGSVNASLFQEAKDIVTETGANYPHLVPSREMIINKLQNVMYVPETVFVDSEGKQVGESVVGAHSKDEWIAIIDGLLENMP